MPEVLFIKISSTRLPTKVGQRREQWTGQRAWEIITGCDQGFTRPTVSQTAVKTPLITWTPFVPTWTGVTTMFHGISWYQHQFRTSIEQSPESLTVFFPQCGVTLVNAQRFFEGRIGERLTTNFSGFSHYLSSGKPVYPSIQVILGLQIWSSLEIDSLAKIISCHYTM